jgi:hypothetical protein
MRKLCTLELTANRTQYTSRPDIRTAVMAGSWWVIKMGVPNSIIARYVGASTSRPFHKSSTYLHRHKTDKRKDATCVGKV